MFTPWGISQNVARYARGLSQVSTAGHGGFMLGKGFANKYLSPEAIAEGMNYGNYLCYEEDCQWAIVVYELPQFWSAMYPKTGDVEIFKHVRNSLERWNPEYLQAKEGFVKND